MTAGIPPKLGFTLVELLVVIGILGLLLTILLPVFLGARERAKATTCTSNLRQLHLAFSQYASENNGYVPPYIACTTGVRVYGGEPNPDPNQTAAWPDQSVELIASLEPYTSSTAIWSCPSDSIRGQGSSSYYFVGLYASVSHPYPHPLLMDRGFQPDITFLRDAIIFRAPRSPSYSHGGRYNALYRDGHVKSQKLEDGWCWEACGFR